jgi:hypothetical protein
VFRGEVADYKREKTFIYIYLIHSGTKDQRIGLLQVLLSFFLPEHLENKKNNGLLFFFLPILRFRSSKIIPCFLLFAFKSYETYPGAKLSSWKGWKFVFFM